MATVKSTNTDYTIRVRDGNGNVNVEGTLNVLGNIHYSGNTTTTVAFFLVGQDNPGPPGGFGNLGLLAQYGLGNSEIAGLRFNVETGSWQISPSVYANGSPSFSPYETILTSGTSYSNANVTSYLANSNNSLSNVFFGDTYSNNVSVLDTISTSKIQANSSLTISSLAPGNVVIDLYSGSLNLSAHKIANVQTPQRAYDAATKFYTDIVVSSVTPLSPCTVATDTSLPAYTYDNAGGGQGATITASANGALVIDGVTNLSNYRVLIKDEAGANAPYNGVYFVTDGGSSGTPFVLTRTVDFNQAAEIPSSVVYVQNGTFNQGTAWQCSTVAPVNIGTTDITFEVFVPKGTLPGNGLVKSGAVMSVNPDPAFMSFTNISGSNALTLLNNISFNSIGVGTAAPVTAGQILASDSITAFSDARLKSNVQTIEDALAKVRKLRGVTFDKDGKAGIGVIAQEVQAVIPEVVQENIGGILSVAYANLVGLLIEAVKDLDKENTELKSVIADIQKKLS